METRRCDVLGQSPEHALRDARLSPAWAHHRPGGLSRR